MWDAFVGFMVNILLLIYSWIGNFGVAIILFTILIRLVTHPLMVSQIKGATKMQAMQKDPEWLEIQAKLKGDKEKLSQAQMKFYQEKGINPLASCLPTVIQFPIIIGLYQALIHSMASTPMELLTLAGYVYPRMLRVEYLIPLNTQFLWMNLSQPERLYLPFLPFGIPVLAVLVVITTYMQSKLMTPPAGNPGDQSAMMSNMMNLYMPFLMGWMAYSLASGLALYFLTSNIIGVAQYAMLGKLDWRNLLPKNLLPNRKPVAIEPTAKSTSKSVTKSSAKSASKSK